MGIFPRNFPVNLLGKFVGKFARNFLGIFPRKTGSFAIKKNEKNAVTRVLGIFCYPVLA